jgi:hypothetical protein
MANPASVSLRIVSLYWLSCENNSTSLRTRSNDGMVVMGGTCSSESNVSGRPSSVRIPRREDVAMMRRRRP